MTNLVLHYGGFGDPLRLWMEEDGIVSEAAIPTTDVAETLEFDFTRPNVTAQLILASEHLKGIFAELDMTSNFVEFAVCTKEQNFTISTFGTSGDVAISVIYYKLCISLYI